MDSLHAKDTYIFMQLWHMGRQSHPSSRSTLVAPRETLVVSL